MAGGYGGLGNFAGGFANGFMTVQKFGLEADKAKREKEKHDFEMANLRREDEANAAAARAAATTQVPTDYQIQPGATGNLDEGDVYTPVMRRLAPEEAQMNAVQAYRAAGGKFDKSLQMEQTALGVQGARRTERYAQNEEDVNDFLRKHAATSDPEFARAAAQFATRFGDDGKSFGVEQDENGGMKIVRTVDGVAHSRPIANRQELEQLLMSYASPQARQKAEELGLKRRQVGAQETTAAATKENAQRQSEFYAPGGVFERTHDLDRKAQVQYYKALFGADRNPEQIVNFTDRKTGEMVPFRFNRQTGGFEKLSLPEGMALGGPKGVLQPLGATGLLTDGARAFAYNDRENRLVEVQTPQSLQAVGDVMRQNLQNGQGLRPRGVDLSSTFDRDTGLVVGRQIKRDLGSGLQAAGDYFRNFDVSENPRRPGRSGVGGFN